LFVHGWTGLAIGTTLVGLAIGWWQAAAAMFGHAILFVFVIVPSSTGSDTGWAGRTSGTRPTTGAGSPG